MKNTETAKKTTPERKTFATYAEAKRSFQHRLAEELGNHPNATSWEETFATAEPGVSIGTDLFVISNNSDATFLVEETAGDRYITASENTGLKIECLSIGEPKGRLLGLLLHRKPGMPASTIQPIHKREGSVGEEGHPAEGYDWIFFYENENVAGFKWTEGNFELYRILLVDWNA